MVNNPEIVSRLLANTALLKGERELLRQPEKPPAPDEEAKPAQPVANPIENDSRAVSTVLLTLLDERLQAAESLAGRPGLAGTPGSDSDAQHRVAAKYAADGLIGRDDFAPPNAAVAPDQTRMPNAPPIASADLQTFLQRFAAVALSRSLDVDATEKGARRPIGSQGSPILGSLSALGLAGIAAAGLWLVLLIAQWAAH